MEGGTGNLGHFLILIYPHNFQIKMQINKWFIFKFVGFIFKANESLDRVSQIGFSFQIFRTKRGGLNLECMGKQ